MSNDRSMSLRFSTGLLLTFVYFVAPAWADEALGTYTWDQFLQEKPELVKDGKSVPYRKDKEVSFEGISRKAALDPRSTGAWPQETRKIRTLNLLDWYGSLEPGTYEAIIGHRFWVKGKPIKSNTVTFEIIP